MVLAALRFCSLIIAVVVSPHLCALALGADDDADALRLYKLHIIGGNVSFTTVVEVAGTLDKNLPKNGNEKQEFDVVSYRLSTTDNSVERFDRIGKGAKISRTQLVVVLNEDFKSNLRSEFEALTSANSAVRKAFMFLPKTAQLRKESVMGMKGADFEEKIGGEVRKSGVVLYPADLGFSTLDVTCTCKAFFGCTQGCCTNPTCNVILGICQDNADCKKVDSVSNCQCRQ